MPLRLTGAVIAALCLHSCGVGALHAAPIYLRMGCGYALYRTCYVDPATYGQLRTVSGCQALAARIGERAECVEVKGK